MFDMFLNSVVLFMRGKLFQDPRSVFINAFAGIALTIVVCVGLVQGGVPFWVAAIVSGLVGGAAQPWLFRNLKYR